MRKIVLGLSLILICLNGLALSQTVVTDEEYEFYKKIIDKKYVILRNTQEFELATIEGARQKMRWAPAELFMDFSNKNSISHKLDSKLKGYRFSDEPRPSLDKKGELHFVFDDLMAVSRVGFSKNKKHALVFLSFGSEALSGGSSSINLYVLKKGKWKLRSSYAPWIH